MKKIALACLLLVVTTSVTAQRSIAPLRISGKIVNANAAFLTIQYESATEVIKPDTIPLATDGSFSFTTEKIVRPVFATLNSSTMVVAPGFELNLTVDNNSLRRFFETAQFSGKGASVNRLLKAADSIGIARFGGGRIFDLPEPAALQMIKDLSQLKDSITGAYRQAIVKEPYGQQIIDMITLNNAFSELVFLTSYCTFKVHDRTRYNELVNRHFSKPAMLQDLYNERNLSASQYLYFMRSVYPDFLAFQDYSRDSSLRSRPLYVYEKISNVYKGKIRAYVLYNKMNTAYYTSKSLPELYAYIKGVEPYYALLQNNNFEAALNRQLIASETFLKARVNGQQAPPFKLIAMDGKAYSLSDFAGKVVYLDLWASWCKPCREQTPYMQALANHFKDRPDLVIIGISMDRDRAAWLQAIKEDRPTWLQLKDDGAVRNGYGAREIPQFVLIDKQGKVIDLHASRPDSGDQLVKQIETALAEGK